MAALWNRLRTLFTKKTEPAPATPHSCCAKQADAPSGPAPTAYKPIKRVFINEGCTTCNACEAECPEVFHVPGTPTGGYSSAFVMEGAEVLFELKSPEIHAAAAGCCMSVIGIEYTDGTFSSAGSQPYNLVSSLPRLSEPLESDRPAPIAPTPLELAVLEWFSSHSPYEGLPKHIQSARFMSRKKAPSGTFTQLRLYISDPLQPLEHLPHATIGGCRVTFPGRGPVASALLHFEHGVLGALEIRSEGMLPPPEATGFQLSGERASLLVTRQDLREVLVEWQSGQRSAAEVHDWAEARHLVDAWEPEDEVANEVLAHLDGLDMNLVVPEDVPLLLKVLELPPEAGAEASERMASHGAAPPLRERAQRLAGVQPYAPFAEALLHTAFRCTGCGEEHDLTELSFGADAPAVWDGLTDEERAASELTSDQCVIEARGETSFYQRACLEIPIRGTNRVFTWGVWLSLSEKSFMEVCDTWEDPQRVEHGPYFGWLTTSIPTYPETGLMKAMVHQRPVGQRPWVELEATDHPLAVHQREGIDPLELQAKVMEILHGDGA